MKTEMERWRKYFRNVFNLDDKSIKGEMNKLERREDYAKYVTQSSNKFNSYFPKGR